MRPGLEPAAVMANGRSDSGHGRAGRSSLSLTLRSSVSSPRRTRRVSSSSATVGATSASQVGGGHHLIFAGGDNAVAFPDAALRGRGADDDLLDRDALSAFATSMPASLVS